MNSTAINTMQRQLGRLQNLEQKIECLINPIEHMKYKIEYIRNKLNTEINEKFSHLIEEYKESNPSPFTAKGFVNTQLYKKMLGDEVELAKNEERIRVDDVQLFKNFEVKRYKHDFQKLYTEEILKFNTELQDWTNSFNLWEKENIKPLKDKYTLELVEMYFGYDKIVSTPHFSKLVEL